VNLHHSFSPQPVEVTNALVIMTKSNSSGSIVSLATAAIVSVSGLAVVTTALWWNHRAQSKPCAATTVNRDSNEEAVEARLTNDGPVQEIQWNDDGVREVDGDSNNGATAVPRRRILSRGCVTIVHGSVTGTCAKFATSLYDAILWESSLHSGNGAAAHVQIGSTEDFDWWDELINDENETNTPTTDHTELLATLIIVLPTYTNGTWPPIATGLQEALQELQNDWRIAAKPVKNKLQAAVFGMGSSAYNSGPSEVSTTSNDSAVAAAVSSSVNNMGQPAKEATKALQRLGAKVLARLAIGDDAVGNHADETFATWQASVLQQLYGRPKPLSQKTKTAACACQASSTESTNGETAAATGCCQQHSTETGNQSDAQKGKEKDKSCCNSEEEAKNYDDFDNFAEEEEFSDEEEDDDDAENVEPDVMDLEDIGDAVVASRRQKLNSNNEPQEMVTPSQAVALRKEGYKLIGTHSAVKLCRWTKHQLRGRGGCYKHTFYGITSYQCMEATPSLACANKCVFCWRHHKNPVGKEWRWKTDDPYFIVDQAVQTHIQMIKETRGIPGVQLDRWKEAHTVRHCALSLVGEPIMYPRIDELLGELHRRNISTFLVTNGQHPSAIATLRPITQLYVSVDAPTEPSLIAIDRPLFSDAWDRLKLSLSSLKDKGQRTVARLTVVKGWNSDEISGYAALIALGQVSLVEVKGVTFCGKSDASNLNMTNSPWHHEVVELTRTLRDELAQLRVSDSSVPEYDLACEHKHSCSVLLARVDQFTEASASLPSASRQWRTWIDYDKFQELAAKQAKDPTFSFSVRDYTAPTPSWALFGAEEEGFDPTDRRHRKQTKYPMYTRFDSSGVPTHDFNDAALAETERARLTSLMQQRKKQIGEGSTVTELRGGEKEILDASLMFRGLVVAK
jgi:tRNA wybutosine-synthesizing protein 1